MRLNVPAYHAPTYTHEGAPARRIDHVRQLKRSVMSCLLWEKEFYEDGTSIATRILETAALVPAETVAAIAHEARHTHGLRHVPLLLLSHLVERGGQGKPATPCSGQRLAQTIAQVLSRADEPGELLALHTSRVGNRKFTRPLRTGLGLAMRKFDEYQLAKYDRDGAFRLRDVLRIARPKPESEEQAALWHRVVRRELATPDTWEVELSRGADKRETFERLLSEGKLGYMALLRNLRKMLEVNVDQALVEEAIRARKGARWVLPHRYVAAARAAPRLEAAIDEALRAAIEEAPRLSGTTAVLVDVSGSMDSQLSQKSDMKRIDAAAALGAIVQSDQLRVFTFSDQLVEVPARRGMAGVDAIVNSQRHNGTALGAAVAAVMRHVPDYDRLICVSDEQSRDPVPNPKPGAPAYMINVASAKNGVGYGPWVHIDGFSESVLRYIMAREAEIHSVD